MKWLKRKIANIKCLFYALAYTCGCVNDDEVEDFERELDKAISESDFK